MLIDGQFEAEMDRLLANYSNAGDGIIDAFIQVQHAEGQRNELQTRLQEIQLRCAELENNNQKLMEEWSNQETEHRNVIQRLNNEIADWMGKHDRLENIIERLESEIADCMAKLAEFEVEKRTSRIADESFSVIISQLEMKNVQLQDELSCSDNKLRENQKRGVNGSKHFTV